MHPGDVSSKGAGEATASVFGSESYIAQLGSNGRGESDNYTANQELDGELVAEAIEMELGLSFAPASNSHCVEFSLFRLYFLC